MQAPLPQQDQGDRSRGLVRRSRRDRVVKEFNTIEGGQETMARLAAHLVKMR
jgi:hypothetical protein